MVFVLDKSAIYRISNIERYEYLYITTRRTYYVLEQQYLCGQQKPFWTEEPTTTNTKFEEQPIEEINEYIQIFTTINLEID